MPSKKPARKPPNKLAVGEQPPASGRAAPGKLYVPGRRARSMEPPAEPKAPAVDKFSANPRRTSATTDSDYVSAATVRALLRQGRPESERRLRAADMISVHQAALLVGESASTVNRWIASRKCIGVRIPGHTMRLPIWQFADDLLLWISHIALAIQAKSGWAVLSFLESPHGGLGGRTPRQAIEQGEVERVLAIASAD